MKRMLTFLLAIVGVLAAYTLFLAWREPHMLYYPDRHLDDTPRSLGFDFEDVQLTTADGVRIHGWFLPCSSPVLRTPSPRVRGEGQGEGSAPLTVLFFHGNAGNISHRLEKLNTLHNLGVDTLIIDYRGYGRSAGTPNERGTYADADAAYEHLTKTLNREPRTVIAYGESLGSAVAVDLASRMPVGAVVIEEAFTSVPDVAQGMFPFLPVRWLVRNKYDALGKIAGINAPLLIIHSRDDEFFSMRHAERLFAAAREPKRLVELRGGHNDAFIVSAEPYVAALREFFASLQ